MIENKDRLASLILNNPKLKVICMVDGDVAAGDDFLRWHAEIGKSEIKKYSIMETYYDSDGYFYKEDFKGVIENIIEMQEITWEEAVMVFEKIEWEEALFVNIDLPT